MQRLMNIFLSIHQTMTIDLLIVSDEKDDLKRYIDPIEQAFRHVKKSIEVERTSTRYVGKDNIPKAKRVLLLLHGSRERAEIVCKSLMNRLDKPRNAGKQMFAITITGNAGGISEENTRINDQNILVLEDIEIFETWIPQFIRKFFVIDMNGKGRNVNVQNISPEYVLAKQTENSIRSIFSHFGVSFTAHSDSNACFVVARSGRVHDSRKNIQFRTLQRESRASDVQMFCVSTTNRSTAGYADVYQLPVYGRPDIVTCIVMALCHLNIIPGSRFKQMLSKCSIYSLFSVKVVLSSIILLMHFIFALSQIPLTVIGFGLCSLFHLFLTYDDEFELPLDFGSNMYATGIWLGLIWGLDMGNDPIINGVITLIVVCFYIVLYSIVHLCVLRGHFGYEYGFFEFPWVWWQKKP